jgi:hypothetical protein
MTFQSILFERPEDRVTKDAPEAPVFFVDLNLDQIIEAITASRAEYNLKPFFYRSLSNTDAIHYRHEIMQDLQNVLLYEHIRSFYPKNARHARRFCPSGQALLPISEGKLVLGRGGNLLRRY